MEVTAMWRLAGAGGRTVLFLDRPAVSILTVNTRRLLAWAQEGQPDKLALLVANLDRTYVEPGSAGEAERARLQRLVAQPGAQTHREREDAEAALRSEGSLAIPVLDEAMGSDDPEVAVRVRQLIRAIEGPVPQTEVAR